MTTAIRSSSFILGLEITSRLDLDNYFLQIILWLLHLAPFYLVSVWSTDSSYQVIRPLLYWHLKIGKVNGQSYSKDKAWGLDSDKANDLLSSTSERVYLLWNPPFGSCLFEEARLSIRRHMLWWSWLVDQLLFKSTMLKIPASWLVSTRLSRLEWLVITLELLARLSILVSLL